MNFLRFWCNYPLPADEHHSTRGWYEIRGIDPVTLFFFQYHRADIGDQILVASSFAEKRAEVVVVLAEKTSAQLAVRGQADTRAVAAEGLRHRSDQADLARRAVGKAVFTSGFAPLVRNLLQRPPGMNALVHFPRGDHQAARPMPVGVEWHEFDEAHDHPALAGKAGKGFHFVVIYAAHEHGVYFSGGQR